MTHATVFWELTYAFLVWNRFTRPWVLLMAVLIHGGIALALGMATFGLVMLIGNVAFIPPATIRRWVDPITKALFGWLPRLKSEPEQGRAVIEG
jgi:hypothetical protein